MRLLRFGLVLACLSMAPSVMAAPPRENDPEGKLVKDMVKDAIADEKAGKCKEALAILRQAAAIRETGEVLLYVGECQAQQGAVLEALKTWENAEDIARNEKDRGTQQFLSQKIEALRAHVPTILLRIPRDAGRVQVKIDDQPQPAERINTPILVNPGEHTLSVTADGRLPFTRKLVLKDKDAAVINVELAKVGAPTDGAVEVQAKPAGPAVPLGTWIAGGAAVVLAAGGVVAFVAAGSAASDGKAQCAKEVKCDTSQQHQVQKLDAMALGLWIGAGASAAFGVTWWATHRPQSPDAPPPAAASVTVGPTGAWLHGTF